ncbi:MAG TPA: hypothetical protein VI757_01995 [Bacteroidia bacterium]|nr:hypothetical protein [Bacteroidia bacterium]
MTKKIIFMLLVISAFSRNAFSQDSDAVNSASRFDYFLPIERSMFQRYEEKLSARDILFHTAFRTWRADEVRKVIPFDSLNTLPVKDSKFNRTWLGRKLRKEHLFTVDKDDFRLAVDPLFDFSVSRETEQKKNLYTNTRGAQILGSIGKQFTFYTGFYETQATFVHYLDSTIRFTGVVPGQGKVKVLKGGGFDYGLAFGGVSYTPSKYFNVQLANDKNFIGDGYRSLLLSDNAFNYPFLKLTADVWRFKYTVLYAEFIDLLSPHDPDLGYRKKYGTFHYLDINIGKPLYFGFFEAVIWKTDLYGARGFELSYLNPVIFLRPVEGSLDSPDNMMLGANVRYKISDHTAFYGQLMLDEFKLDEIKSGKGWWANKQAFQVGIKSFSVARIKNLNLQTEFNFVRPYTFQHRSTLQNYAHYNQALAHPLGANFIETVGLLDYRWKHWYMNAKIISSIIGKDTAGLNFGSNIFSNYFTYNSPHGNYALQGLKTNLLYYELKFGYTVNPLYNFNIELGIAGRDYKNDLSEEKTMLITFGIRTNLTDKYYDF